MAEGWTETRDGPIVVASYAAPPMSYFTDAAIGELERMISADFRIAQRGDFRIGLPEVRLGISPGGSGLTRLTKIVGRARALDLVLRARVVTPEDALALGMVTELADDALGAAVRLARELAALPTLAVALAKKAIRQGADLPMDLALTLETEASFRVKQSPETMSAMRAYLDQPLESRRAYLEGETEADRA